MSYVTIYRIDPEGDVELLGDAKNNHGFAPLVWHKLIEQYKVPTKGTRYWDDDYYQPLWSLLGTGKLERLDDILLGATFDRVWIGRALVPELIESMRIFDQRHIVPNNLVRTISEAADVLAKWLTAYPDDRGIAFNMCSATESFWMVWDEENEESRPYNIDKDPGGKGRHWELTVA